MMGWADERLSDDDSPVHGLGYADGWAWRDRRLGSGYWTGVKGHMLGMGWS